MTGRVARAILLATLVVLPLLPLPALLASLGSTGRADTLVVRPIPVHDYEVPKRALLALAGLVLAALGTFAGFARQRAGDPLEIPRAAAPLAGLAILAFASTIWATRPDLAIHAGGRLLALGVLFVAAWHVARTRPPLSLGPEPEPRPRAASEHEGGAARALARAIALPVGVVAVYGIAQRAGFDFASLAWADAGRAVSTLGNTNLASEFLVVALPFAIAVAATARTRPGRIAAWTAAGAGTLHLALTETRAGWVSIAAGGAAALALAALARPPVPSASARGRDDARSDRKPSRKFAPVALPIAGAVAVLALLAIPALDGGAVLRKAASVFDPSHPSTRVRLSLYADTAEMIRERPLAGVGAGNFVVRFPEFRHPAEAELSGYLTTVRTPHQDLLQLAAELGLPGAALALLFVAAVARATVARVRRARAASGTDEAAPADASAMGGIEVAAAAAATGFVVNGLFRSPLDNPAAVPAFAVACAILARDASFAICGPAARGRPIRPRLVLPAAAVVVAMLLAADHERRALAADRAIRLSRAHEIAATRTADAAIALDALDRSARALDRGSAADPQCFDCRVRAGRARARAAEVAALRGDTDGAEERRRAAREDFERAVDLRPGDPSARVGLAIREAELGDFAEADRQLDEAQALAPSDPTLAFNRGRLRVLQERFGEAAVAFERAAALRPRHAPTLRELVRCYERLQADAERPELGAFLPLIEEARVREQLAIALDAIDRGEEPLALEAIARARREAVPDPAWADTLEAWVLERLRRTEEARVLRERAREGAPRIARESSNAWLLDEPIWREATRASDPESSADG